MIIFIGWGVGFSNISINHFDASGATGIMLVNSAMSRHDVSMFRVLLCFVASLIPNTAEPTTPDAIAKQILAPLVNPVKVDTLNGPRPVNARTYRLLY